jgi:hypothetical protein
VSWFDSRRSKSLLSSPKIPGGPWGNLASHSMNSGDFPKGVNQPGEKLIYLVHLLLSLGITRVKQAVNFTFSISEKKRVARTN